MNKIEVIEKALPLDIEQAYAQVREGALVQIRSLKVVRSRAKRTSNYLKGAAFVLLSAGIILPLGSAVVGAPFEKPIRFNPLAAGYIAIALGGLCTLADQVFGFAQNHDRVRLLEMRLVGMLRDLDFNWSLRRLAASADVAPDPAADLQSLFDFRMAVDRSNATQVEEWIAQRRVSGETLSERLTAAPPRPNK